MNIPYSIFSFSFSLSKRPPLSGFVCGVDEKFPVYTSDGCDRELVRQTGLGLGLRGYISLLDFGAGRTLVCIKT